MSPAALLPLALLVVFVVFASSFGAVLFAGGPWARVKIDEVKIGFGPDIFTRVVRGTTIVISLFPITASAKPRGMNPYEEDVVPPEPPLVLWADASAGRRILLLLVVPRLIPAAIGALMVGPRAFIDAFIHGFADVSAAFYAPLPMLDRAAERVSSEGFFAIVGLAIAKLLAWHFVQFFADLLPILWRERKTAAKAVVVVQLALASVGVAWIVGFVRWILR